MPTDAFYCHGKLSLYDKMARSFEARNLLSKCGQHLPLTVETLDDIRSYVIRYVYSDTVSSSVDEARATKWEKQKNKSILRIPPDADYL